MKKTLSLIALLFALTSYSQLEVTEISTVTKEIYSDAAGHVIKMHIFENDTGYIFSFRNAKYSRNKDLVSIDFNDEIELVQFVDLIATSLKNDKEYETRSYRITQGSINNSVTVLTPSGYFYIGDVWVDKIKEKLTELGLK